MHSFHLSFGVAEALLLTILALETSCDIPKGILNSTIRKIQRVPHQEKDMEPHIFFYNMEKWIILKIHMV